MRLAVKGAWVLENVRRLGSGAFYHLAYATNQVHPEVLNQLRTTTPPQGKVRIYWLSQERLAIGFASGEIIAIHWFPEFVRIHFMILNVLAKENVDNRVWEEEYLVLPSEKPEEINEGS
jgi:hypothetical protein